MDLDDDERIAKFVEKQIERAGGLDEQVPQATDLQRDNDEQKVAFSVTTTPSSSKTQEKTK